MLVAAGASSDMGSEHYCLRWNNHQSNLLGVFSQLLHDESLVDVTLACSEGASIRAHKVVLSACSSYFRALFVDHPSRHPIVILKDVRLTELRTLVDFMYKGEVNVEYCQLPALLKTAESLQVKGLAEMTTLSAAGIDTRNVPERMDECPSQETREHRESHERMDTRDIRDVRENREVREVREIRETMSARERDHREGRDTRENREVRDSRDIREPHEDSPPRASPLLAVRRHRHEPAVETHSVTHPPPPKDEPPDDQMRPSSPEDDAVSIRSNGALHNENIGFNMTINSHNSSGTTGGSRFSPVDQRMSILNAIPHSAHSSLPPHPVRLPSPRGEPIAGPSGLPPVQQVPLSLKKEIDWERGNDDKSGEGSSDYRLQHESMCVDVTCGAPSLVGPIPPRSPTSLPLWSPFLLHACRPWRYLSDDCLGYERRRCTVCLATFPSSWLLERHAALQHASQTSCDDKPFVCEQCGQTYRYRSAYMKHREQNHRARLPADKLFTCDVCGMQFRYLKSFKKHRLNHTLERLHIKNTEPHTEGVDQVSSTNEVLMGRCGEMDLSMKKNKKRSSENESEEVQEGEQDSTVDSNGPSDLVLTVDDSMDYRNSSMEGDSKYREPDVETTLARAKDRVPVSFASVSSMADSSENESSRTDSSNRIQESTSSRQAVDLLGFLHTDDRQRERERRFACQFCGKCVRSKENLKLHVRKHTGERPFVCLFCGRAFGGKSDLTRHLRIHTGERPYHCEACGKCFARADYLSKHLTTHVHNAR